MRITVKVGGAGKNGVSRIPYLDIKSINEDLCTDGHFDPSKFRALVKDIPGIQLASDDCTRVLAFAAELINQSSRACHRLIAGRRDKEDTMNAHDKSECPDDRHAVRNLDKGRCVFVRIDIGYSYVTETLKLRIDVQNPRNVVGVAENIARDYALIVARVANNMHDQLAESHGGLWRCEMIGGSGFPDIFDEARKIDADLALRTKNEERLFCERRTSSGYCSPCKFDCPHCKGGKCVEL